MRSFAPTFRFRILFGLLIPVFAFVFAGAPDAAAGEAPKTEEKKKGADEKKKKAPPTRATPSATLTTYIVGITSTEETRRAEAVACFDLSGIEAVDRAVFGPRYANRLLDILDRTWKVDPKKAVVGPGETAWRLDLKRQSLCR